MTDHIGDLAALYALGALDEGERLEVEQHIDTCTACAHLLARAQEDVATIASAQAQHVPPPELAARIAGIASGDEAALPSAPPARRRGAPAWIAAVAAAVVLAVLPSAYFMSENAAMHRAMLADAAAMARISSSPHKNVAFTGLGTADTGTGNAEAHVMYGPDGSWYCVIVRGITRPLQVVWPHDGERTMLGTAVPHGDVALLYLPKSHRMEQLALMQEDRVVASAQLAFQ